MSKLKKPTKNNIIFVLLKLKRVQILRIIIVSLNYMIYEIAKPFFNKSH